MPGFKFELSQLVMVPGKNQQGRISGRMEFVGEETVYQIKWLDDDLNVYTEMFKEREVVAAQPTAREVSNPVNVDVEKDFAEYKLSDGSLDFQSRWAPIRIPNIVWTPIKRKGAPSKTSSRNSRPARKAKRKGR